MQDTKGLSSVSVSIKKARSSYLHKWSYDAWIFHCNHHRVLLGEAGMGKSGWQDPGRGCHSCWMAGESSLVTIVGKGDFASGNWIFDYWKNFPNYFPIFLPKLGEGLFFRRRLSLSYMFSKFSGLLSKFLSAFLILAEKGSGTGFLGSHFFFPARHISVAVCHRHDICH